jgi:hypothetical protein
MSGTNIELKTPFSHSIGLFTRFPSRCRQAALSVDTSDNSLCVMKAKLMPVVFRAQNAIRSRGETGYIVVLLNININYYHFATLTSRFARKLPQIISELACLDIFRRVSSNTANAKNLHLFADKIILQTSTADMNVEYACVNEM